MARTEMSRQKILQSKSKSKIKQINDPILARPYPKRSGEHEVHPYLKPERLCRGESCIRLYYPFAPFQAFSDRL
jgi:hypothetical protein